MTSQGDSKKLDDSGPGSYRLAEHQRYIDDFVDQLELDNRVTLMMHDWGVRLGLTWGTRNQERLKGIAHMQGLMGDLDWGSWNPEVSSVMKRLRTEDGEAMILNQNLFVEKVLPTQVIVSYLTKSGTNIGARTVIPVRTDVRP